MRWGLDPERAQSCAKPAPAQERGQRADAGAGLVAAGRRRGLDQAAGVRTVRHRRLRAPALAGAPMARCASSAARARESRAPAWFQQLVPISAADGVAQVSNGWQAAGAVEVRSHSAYASDALWASCRLMLIWLAGVTVVALAGRMVGLAAHSPSARCRGGAGRGGDRRGLQPGDGAAHARIRALTRAMNHGRAREGLLRCPSRAAAGAA